MRLTDRRVLQIRRCPTVARQIDGALAVGIVRHVLFLGSSAFAGFLSGRSGTQSSHPLEPKDFPRSADDVVDGGWRTERS